MKKRSVRVAFASIAALSLLVAACGGSDDAADEVADESTEEVNRRINRNLHHTDTGEAAVAVVHPSPVRRLFRRARSRLL